MAEAKYSAESIQVLKDLDAVRKWLRTQETAQRLVAARSHLAMLQETAGENDHEQIAALADRCGEALAAKLQTLNVTLGGIANEVKDNGIPF